MNSAAATYGSALANHESYLLCPNEPAMKLDTSFPVSRVRVFYRKLTNRHAKLKSIQNNVHIERRDDSQPRNYIDIYHWSIDWVFHVSEWPVAVCTLCIVCVSVRLYVSDEPEIRINFVCSNYSVNVSVLSVRSCKFDFNLLKKNKSYISMWSLAW